jgi:N-acetyl sugar amidotransferase
MDTSDPGITFNDDGFCNHCTTALERMDAVWLRGDEGQRAFAAKVDEIRAHRKGEYDSILGLSGGVDSSYLAHAAVSRGLKPLVVHIDAGWNSEIAVANVHALVTKLGLELVTQVIPWDEMRDLQVAYLRAGVANQDTPQDHALFSGLFRLAAKHGVKYVLNGWNFASESILPPSWGYSARDGRQVRAIHQRFGSRPLKDFPVLTYRRYYLEYLGLRRLKLVQPLNWLPYDPVEARAFLEREVGWRDYGGKHTESRWTKFFQHYYLPTYFGFDKRRAHLSSLIVAGQLTREEAMAELAQPAFDAREVELEKDYIARKLGLPLEDFQALLAGQKHSWTDYPHDAEFDRLVRDPRLAGLKRWVKG